jgi:hypothetical protein
MAITSLSTSSLVSGVKRRRVWDQTATTDGFFQIATTTLNVAASSVTFSSIPQDYTHLQIRGIVRSTLGAALSAFGVQFNATTSGYFSHLLYGDGSSGDSANVLSSTNASVGGSSGASATANIFSSFVLDILDYTNTNKNKTTRAFTGADLNGSGQVRFTSGSVALTSAITSLKFIDANGANFAQYSSFALYGIKG